MAPSRFGERWRAALWRSWWAPRSTWLTHALTPLAWLYGALARRWPAAPAWTAPCPVVVVGNLIVGGAGKTPTVIALVQALSQRGLHPGVISRGYGRRGRGVSAVGPASDSAQVGDEPLLIQRRTGVPVCVADRRVDAAKVLLASHPEVDVLVADDGLQHSALARDAELWVFDERGVGNGALLPAGPLRQPLPSAVPEGAFVLYNAPAASTPLPGLLARRRLCGAVALADWHTGAPMQMALLQSLAQRRPVAVAGVAAPQRFFDMLIALGIAIEPLPLPDHADFDTLPWPAGTEDVVCTEKDAVKIDPARCGATRVWVVGLDLQLPPDLVTALHRRLLAHRPS